jgi:hypothetical protein
VHDLQVLDVQLKPRRRARTRPLTITDDSCVSDLTRSKTSAATAALGTMPWIVPVPSRKMGNSSLPLSRML